MPKISPQNLIDLGFSPQMYGKDPDLFAEWLRALIEEQATDLMVRIGAAYQVSSEETARTVRMAEKALCAAELVRRRMVQVMSLAVPNGEQSPVREMQAQRREYLDEAERWIARISAGVTSDGAGYSGAVVVSAHGLQNILPPRTFGF